MSVRAIDHYFVRCETCSEVFDAGDADNPMAARIAAGITGWKFRGNYPGRTGGRTSCDYCPNCEVPSA